MSSVGSPSNEHKKIQTHFLGDIEKNVKKYQNCVRTQASFINAEIYALIRLNDINSKHIDDSRLNSGNCKSYRDSINNDTQENMQKLKKLENQRNELIDRMHKSSRWSDYYIDEMKK